MYALNMNDAGAVVRDAREAAGMSQRALAARAGVPLSTVGRIERGVVDPRWDTLRALASALGADIDLSFAPRLPDWLARHREQISAVCRQHGASHVAVFGSMANGTSTDDSDLDLLVDLAPTADLLSLVRIERELHDLLGIDVDVVPREALTDAMVPRRTIPLRV